MSVEDQLRQAYDLLRAKRYDEARPILESLDHPKAREWLAQLDRVAPVRPQAAPLQPGLYGPADPGPLTERKDYSTADLREARARFGEAGEDRAAPIGGVLLLLLIAVAGGLGVGLLLFLSSKIIYLICGSVLIAGGIGGFILAQAVKIGKVRHAALAAACGVMMGLVSYGAYRYFEAQDIRDQLYQAAIDGGMSAQLADTTVDGFLQEQFGASGIGGIISLQAREGMSITRAGRSSGGGLAIGSELTVVYWLLEILVMAALPAISAQSSTQEPFCEDTNDWLEMKLIGKVAQESSESFLRALAEGDFRGAQGALAEGKLKQPYLEVRAGRCHDQSPQALLHIKVVNGRNSKDVLKSRINTAQYNALVPPGRL